MRSNSTWYWNICSCKSWDCVCWKEDEGKPYKRYWSTLLVCRTLVHPREELACPPPMNWSDERIYSHHVDHFDVWFVREPYGQAVTDPVRCVKTQSVLKSECKEKCHWHIGLCHWPAQQQISLTTMAHAYDLGADDLLTPADHEAVKQLKELVSDDLSSWTMKHESTKTDYKVSDFFEFILAGKK